MSEFIRVVRDIPSEKVDTGRAYEHRQKRFAFLDVHLKLFLLLHRLYLKLNLFLSFYLIKVNPYIHLTF